MSDFNAYLEIRSVDACEFAKRASHLLELQNRPPGDHVINEFETTKDTLTQLLTTAQFRTQRSAPQGE